MRFLEALQGEDGIDQIDVGPEVVSVGGHFLAVGYGGFFVLAELSVSKAEVSQIGAEGIVVVQLLIGFDGFLKVTGGVQVVIGGDGQAFVFAGLFAKLEGLGEVIGGAADFTEGDVVFADGEITQSEVWV